MRLYEITLAVLGVVYLAGLVAGLRRPLAGGVGSTVAWLAVLLVVTANRGFHHNAFFYVLLVPGLLYLWAGLAKRRGHSVAEGSARRSS